MRFSHSLDLLHSPNLQVTFLAALPIAAKTTPTPLGGGPIDIFAVPVCAAVQGIVFRPFS